MAEATQFGVGRSVTIHAAAGATINITLAVRSGVSHGSSPLQGGSAHCQREALFAGWLQSEVDTSEPGAAEASAALYHAYQGYCVRGSIPPCCVMSLTRFGRELSARGFAKKNGRAGRVERVGCRLVTRAAADTECVEPSLPLVMEA